MANLYCLTRLSTAGAISQRGAIIVGCEEPETKTTKVFTTKDYDGTKLTLNILDKIPLNPMEDQDNSEDKTRSEDFHLALNN